MTDTSTEQSLEDRAWAAAEVRYELLDSQMRVELSGHMPHEHVRPAADAATGLVRRELVSTYAALLEANALRDDAIQRAELAEAEAASLRQHIDDSIARQAATTARRAKEIADRAAHLAQFAADRTADTHVHSVLRSGIVAKTALSDPEPAGHFAKCTRCTSPVFVHDDGSTDGGVDTADGILCDKCLNDPMGA